jgi:hypothetical protein
MSSAECRPTDRIALSTTAVEAVVHPLEFLAGSCRSLAANVSFLVLRECADVLYVYLLNITTKKIRRM